MSDAGDVRRWGGGGLRFFASHPTAANLVMLVMIIIGLAAATRLNTQFFPEFGVDYITVEIAWPGASAEDIDSSVVEAVDTEVRAIDRVKNVDSFAYRGLARMMIEFEAGSNMAKALSDVDAAVARITTFPPDIETPVVSKLDHYDNASEIILSGPYPEASLKAIAKQIRDDLLDRGLAKVELFGARDEEIWIELRPETLRRLDLTLEDIADRVAETSQDVPSGVLRGDVGDRQVRSLGRLKTAEDLSRMEIRALSDGQKIHLGEVAAVRGGFDRDAPSATRKGTPAIVLTVQRAQSQGILEVAAIVDGYFSEVVPGFPPELRIERFHVASQMVRERIDILIWNGLGGLLLVLAVLFLFLDVRIAFWVAVGIPVSVLAALGVMWASGQTINMLSLFGLIMAIGIVVDDAIVVGEHGAHRFQSGLSPLDAAVSGASRMLAPVSSASLTTIAAFTPLFLISGIIGDIIIGIPLVVVAVVVASLIECFFVLPGHLTGAFKAQARANKKGRGRFREWFDGGFDRFRNGPFRRLVVLAVSWRYATLALALSMLVVSIGLVQGGRVGFHFFPAPESDVIYANVEFAAGTPRVRTERMTQELDRALNAAIRGLGGDPEELLVMSYGAVGMSFNTSGEREPGYSGDNIGAFLVELRPSDRRRIRTASLIDAWRDQVRPVGGLRNLTIMEPLAGPPGQELDIRLTGGDLEGLRAAADEVSRLLAGYPGVSDIDHDLPAGKPETIVELTPRGKALGFTTASVGRQIRGAFEGVIADRFNRGDEEVIVRVLYPERDAGARDLGQLHLRAPRGHEVPLTAVASLRDAVGVDRITRQDGQRQVAITAAIDEETTSSGDVIAALTRDGLLEIARDHGVHHRFAGKAEEEEETAADMLLGLILGLAAIYIVLAWVFASYSRPIAVMAVIPLGFIGVVLGHWIAGFDLTILSIIALVGLSGIVINDSIVLVTTIDSRRRRGEERREAIINGTCDRLRAVVLTSATTIGGLTPLMFETSLQAQFLIPMALTIVAGLAFATVLILLVVPALVAVLHDFGGLLRTRAIAAS